MLFRSAAVASVDASTRAAAAARWRRGTTHDLRRIVGLARAGVALATRRDPQAARRLLRLERTLSRLVARHGFIAMLAQREIEAAIDEARRPATEVEYLEATRALLVSVAETAARVIAALVGPGGEHGR